MESEALSSSKSSENLTDVNYNDPLLSNIDISLHPILTENAECIQIELSNHDAENSFKTRKWSGL